MSRTGSLPSCHVQEDFPPAINEMATKMAATGVGLDKNSGTEEMQHPGSSSEGCCGAIQGKLLPLSTSRIAPRNHHRLTITNPQNRTSLPLKSSLIPKAPIPSSPIACQGPPQATIPPGREEPHGHHPPPRWILPPRFHVWGGASTFLMPDMN